MTNVQPGDLAQIIRCVPNFEWTLGQVVTIQNACCFAPIFPIWRFTEPLREGSAAIKCAPDHYLKRIEPLTEREARQARADAQEPAPRKRRTLTLQPVKEKA